MGEVARAGATEGVATNDISQSASFSRLRGKVDRPKAETEGGSTLRNTERGAPPSTSLRLVPLPRKRERSPDCLMIVCPPLIPGSSPSP